MRSIVYVLVVDDGRGTNEEDREGEGEVDELVLTERSVLLGASGWRCGRLQGLDGYEYVEEIRTWLAWCACV